MGQFVLHQSERRRVAAICAAALNRARGTGEAQDPKPPSSQRDAASLLTRTTVIVAYFLRTLARTKLARCSLVQKRKPVISLLFRCSGVTGLVCASLRAG